MRHRWVHSVTAVSVAVLVLAAASAAALVGDSQGPFEIDGTLRTTAFGLHNYDNARLFGADNRYSGLSQSSLRLMVMARPADWLSLQVHAVQDLQLTNIPQAPGQPPPLQVPARRYRAFRDRWEWASDPDTSASLLPDRYNFKVSAAWADLTVGRQAITLSKAYLWNPLDIFSPFDPQQFDRDYKPGVDAARLSVPFGEFSGVEILGALGREITGPATYRNSDRFGTDWYGSAAIGRLYSTVSSFDISLEGGKVYGGAMAGCGIVGEAGLGIQVRGESTYVWEIEKRPLPATLTGDFVKDGVQAVLSVGHKWQSSLDAEAEYYFNGAGEGRSNLAAGRLRQLTGGTQQWGKNYAGMTASYEFLPILAGRIVGILSLTDWSALLEPFFTWSVSNESDVVFGAVVNLGERPTSPSDETIPVEVRSEFGTYPNSVFLEFKTYF